MAHIPSLLELKNLLARSGGPPPGAGRAPSALPTSAPSVSPEVRAMVERVAARHEPAAPSQREAFKRRRAPAPVLPQLQTAKRVTKTAPVLVRHRELRNNGPVKAGSTMQRSDGTTVKVLAAHAFGGKRFGCYGRRVMTASGKKTARIFCAAEKPLQRKKGRAS